ncbi:helix-turn-helix transcriptional regulator [Bifidobacterium biavatii]|uniref:Helix-turn-helix domain-containing protein n=1 Tax=Bifidobacterium biavatii DSM 23969 TaxID=1437608 RepID=A0A086ZU47_9BIFI|nr:hypothetical protein [Bifidobacterium biavatii]KFI50047.1 hypothetical protein BBIA_2180 [Bifidobacterium biavatii DSM 23969]
MAGNDLIPENDDGWDVKRTAAFLGIAVQTLYNWSSLDKGPRPRRVGSRLIYSPRAVIHWREHDCNKTRHQVLYGN